MSLITALIGVIILIYWMVMLAYVLEWFLCGDKPYYVRILLDIIAGLII
jgi:hypothetical protein